MNGEIADIQYTDSSFICHQFNHSVFNSEMKFEILKMKDTTFIWIGDTASPKLSDLSLGIQNPNSPNPIATKIMGTASADTTSLGLAERLSKKLKKPVYVSFNVSVINNNVLENIERRLVEEIEINPEKF